MNLSVFARFGALAIAVSIGTVGRAEVRKPIVTVSKIDDPANTGKGPAFAAMIDSAVTSTGKFRVIEANFGALVDQQQRANSGLVTTNAPGRVGKFEGADFLISGTLTSASGGRQSDGTASAARATMGAMFGIPLGNSNCGRAVASLAVDIKIVDAKTGEQRYAKQINQTTTSRMSCSGDASLDVTALLRQAANETAAGLTLTMYPIKVLETQSDGTIVLNYGDSVLHRDMLFAVYAPGHKVVDQDNGTTTTIDGALLGTIRVTDALPQYSKAAALVPFTPPAGAVIREVPVVAATVTGKKRK